MTRTPALLLWCLLLLAPAVHAQGVRAWLDRSHIAVDETATLNIEVTGAASGTPEYAPLLADFRLSGHSSTRSFQPGATALMEPVCWSIGMPTPSSSSPARASAV